MIGALVFVVACVASAFAREHAELHPPYPKNQVAGAAQRDARVREALAGTGWNDARVLPLDKTRWRVTFFAGPRQVLDAAVGPRGQVAAIEEHVVGHPPGSSTLWSPALLVLFSGLFVLAVATRPLLAIRNLDALVVGAAFTVSASLLDDRLVAAHVYVASASLAYVFVRCAMTGLGLAPAAEPAEPLSLGRFAPAITVATAAAAVLLVVTSTGTSDVAFAGLAGGTLLNHGTSPYGHITTEIVHGDTYPLLTYVLYMPVAAISPVRDSFDSLDGALWVNAVALVAGAALATRWGMRTVLAWLAFPPLLLAASSGGNDVPAAAFVVAALATFGREQLSAGLLTLAGWVKIAPAVALVPLIARLRGRTLAQTLAVVIGLVAAGLLVMVVVGGTDSIDRAISALSFQFERGSWFSLWRELGVPAVQVVIQALTIAFLVVSAIVARRDPGISLRRFAGLGGAAVALVQLSGNYWNFAYLAWLLPFVLLALFPAAPRSSQPSAPASP
jgi:hypothetical protein